MLTAGVRTYGAVPPGSEAAPGRYGVFEWRGDGRYDQVEPLKTSPGRSKAEDWRLSHRLGGSPELVVRWVQDKPAEPPPPRQDTRGELWSETRGDWDGLTNGLQADREAGA